MFSHLYFFFSRNFTCSLMSGYNMKTYLRFSRKVCVNLVTLCMGPLRGDRNERIVGWSFTSSLVPYHAFCPVLCHETYITRGTLLCFVKPAFILKMRLSSVGGIAYLSMWGCVVRKAYQASRVTTCRWLREVWIRWTVFFANAIIQHHPEPQQSNSRRSRSWKQYYPLRGIGLWLRMAYAFKCCK